MVGVDLGRLGDVADELAGVFGYVLGGAGVDEVDFEVGKVVGFFFVAGKAAGVGDRAGAGHVPVVDIVGAQVLERAEG